MAKKKAPKKKAVKKAVKKAPKKVAKAMPDLTNARDKNGNAIIPTAQERTAKHRELRAYLKQETDPTKRTAARKAWGPWFKGRA